jgi:hypothetical protein
MRDTGTDFARWVRLALIEAGIDDAVAAFVLELRKQFGGTRHCHFEAPPQRGARKAPDERRDAASTSGSRR